MEGCTWMGHLYGLEQEMQEFGALGMLSRAFVWSHELVTHGLAQYCGKIMKNCIPSHFFHYIYIYIYIFFFFFEKTWFSLDQGCLKRKSGNLLKVLSPNQPIRVLA